MGGQELWDSFLPLVPLLLTVAVVPVVGGGLLWLGCKAAEVPGRDYGQCWKAYLVASLYGALVLVPLTPLLGLSGLGPSGILAAQVVALCATHGLVIPLFLRAHSPRALLAQAVAVLLTNGLTLLVVSQLVGPRASGT